MPAGTLAVIGYRTVETDDPLIRFPWRSTKTDSLSSIDVLRQPACDGLGAFDIRHEEQKICLWTIALDSSQ